MKDVTTPKFVPAPRMTQKREGFSCGEAVRVRLDARTI